MTDPMNTVDPVTLDLLTRALSASTMRHAAHAQNIANANVEGFRPSRVSFDEQLVQVREALDRGEPLRAEDVRELMPALESISTQDRLELDSEVSAMSANGLHYQALLKVLDHQFGLSALAIADGKR